MKRRTLEKKLRGFGWYLERHGSKHDVWTNGFIHEPVPRHHEIAEELAKKILRKAGDNPGINGDKNEV